MVEPSVLVKPVFACSGLRLRLRLLDDCGVYAERVRAEELKDLVTSRLLVMGGVERSICTKIDPLRLAEAEFASSVSK